MAEKAFGASQEGNLDWDNLSNPVPLDFIDPEFPAHPPEPETPPGARSEALPREASEALAESHAAAPETPGAAEAGDRPTLEMPARSGSGTVYGSPWQEPEKPPGPEDDFARIRAKMEAEAEADKRAKLEAEKEEASQRERLEQWMANARARLSKADADLTGPSARVRIRKEPSPTLHRLVELQKTLMVGGAGDATLAQSPNGTLFPENPPKAGPPLDPMATISVPADQFLTLDAPAQPTAREQALARQAAQQATAQQVSHQLAQQAATRHAQEQAAAQPRPVPSPSSVYPSGEIRMDEIPPLQTREQALTRKIAQLRRVAEGSEDAPPKTADPGSTQTALHLTIAAAVIIGILALGIALFAATQAGFFDGLENRVPFLRPKMSAAALGVGRSALPPVPGEAVEASHSNMPATPMVPAAPAASLPVEPAPAPEPPKPGPAVQPAPVRQAARPAAPKAAGNPFRKTAAATAAPGSNARNTMPPASAKNRAKPANLGEIILRASVQAATNIDADNLREMYDRYALGFPGLSGEVVIGLTVEPGGRVLEGSIVSSTTGVEAFDQELLRKVLDWRLRAFPESRPKFITVPFLFPLQGH